MSDTPRCSVQRFASDNGMHLANYGSFVMYDDYAKLERELALEKDAVSYLGEQLLAAREEIKRLKKKGLE